MPRERIKWADELQIRIRARARVQNMKKVTKKKVVRTMPEQEVELVRVPSTCETHCVETRFGVLPPWGGAGRFTP